MNSQNFPCTPKNKDSYLGGIVLFLCSCESGGQCFIRANGMSGTVLSNRDSKTIATVPSLEFNQESELNLNFNCITKW